MGGCPHDDSWYAAAALDPVTRTERDVLSRIETQYMAVMGKAGRHLVLLSGKEKNNNKPEGSKS
jgi:hypothetical protein